MSDRSQYGHGYTFPCLFRIGDDGWVLVSETGLDSRYCGSRLSDVSEGNLYTVAFPMAEENNGNGTVAPAFALPGATPWRTITVGETLKPIVETTVTWDVVRPLYETNMTTVSDAAHGAGFFGRMVVSTMTIRCDILILLRQWDMSMR